MPDHGTDEGICPPAADGSEIVLAADRRGAVRPSCENERSRGGAAQLEEVGGGVRTGHGWRVGDFVVGVQQ